MCDPKSSKSSLSLSQENAADILCCYQELSFFDFPTWTEDQWFHRKPSGPRDVVRSSEPDGMNSYSFLNLFHLKAVIIGLSSQYCVSQVNLINLSIFCLSIYPCVCKSMFVYAYALCHFNFFREFWLICHHTSKYFSTY